MSEESAEKVEESNLEVVVSDGSEAGLPEQRDLTPEEQELYKGLIESVIFLSEEPLSVGALAHKVELDRTNVRIITDTLVDEFQERDGGIVLREIAGGYQFVTSEKYANGIKEIYKERKKDSLTRSALETLSIICYRQPVTLPEIDEIRGAGSRVHINTLLAHNLIKTQGYRPAPGRPTLYVTTRKFLSHFSLNSLTDLPELEEIKELKFDEIE